MKIFFFLPWWRIWFAEQGGNSIPLKPLLLPWTVLLAVLRMIWAEKAAVFKYVWRLRTTASMFCTCCKMKFEKKIISQNEYKGKFWQIITTSTTLSNSVPASLVSVPVCSCLLQSIILFYWQLITCYNAPATVLYLFHFYFYAPA